MCVCIYIYMYMCMYVYTYTYICFVFVFVIEIVSLCSPGCLGIIYVEQAGPKMIELHLCLPSNG